jgi:hypothetical protein
MAHIWGIAIWGLGVTGHPLMNPSFEDADLNPGTAAWWEEDNSATAEDVAPFTRTDGYTYPWEDFEYDWGQYPYNQNSQSTFGTTDLLAAMFEELSNAVESFEYSWREPVATGPVAFNHQALFSFNGDNFAVAKFDTGAEDSEDYEEYWGYSPYNQAAIFSYGAGTFSQGMFDAGADTDEDFENDWGIDPSNQSAVYAFDGANFTLATFDPLAPENHEDFEEGWAEALVT